jgi:3-oxoacyl-[acyl-carrier protein] reductase
MAQSNRAALITGSNRNIGRACALALARAGCNVVVNGSKDRQAAEKVAREVRDLGAQGIVAMGDVGQREDCMRMAEAGIKAFGAIDILVNNAGVDVGKPLLETSDEEWDYILDTNLKGSWMSAVACVPHFITRGGGVIVNTSSVLAMASLPNSGVYSASKSGLHGLTRSMAIEWGHLGIRVNCILPGSTDTDMMWVGLKPDEVPTERRRVDEATPLGRVADPEEIAEATVWFCSDRASFATGSFLWLDGGTSARSPNPR